MHTSENMVKRTDTSEHFLKSVLMYQYGLFRVLMKMDVSCARAEILKGLRTGRWETCRALGGDLSETVIE